MEPQGQTGQSYKARELVVVQARSAVAVDEHWSFRLWGPGWAAGRLDSSCYPGVGGEL